MNEVRCPHCDALLRVGLPLQVELVAPGSPAEESIQALCISLRTYNNLLQAGIRTVGQLVEYSEEELVKKHFGRKSINELIDVLGATGLKLRASQKAAEGQ